jgi:hypothetical protein
MELFVKSHTANAQLGSRTQAIVAVLVQDPSDVCFAEAQK